MSGSPRWVLDGNAILFTTERYGMRAHASWGSQNDAMLVFLNQDAFDKFRLSKEDYELQKELEKEQQKDKEKASIDPKKDKKIIEPMATRKKTKIPTINRYCLHSSSTGGSVTISDAILFPPKISTADSGI